jgi:uncharacterized protein YgiM (DUF1202 family)
VACPNVAKGGKVTVARSFPKDFFDGLTQPPFVMNPGDEVTVVDAPSGAWPAFVLVTSGNGEKGWVPERYLERDGSAAKAARRYDTTTLDPGEGEVLTVVEEDLESGWLWCTDRSGRSGWFAIDHLTEPYS